MPDDEKREPRLGQWAAYGGERAGSTSKLEGDLREAITALKAKTDRGILVGAPKLSTALEELGLIDEYRIVVHP